VREPIKYSASAGHRDCLCESFAGFATKVNNYGDKVSDAHQAAHQNSSKLALRSSKPAEELFVLSRLP
jgi:hypothetical protein